MSDYMHVDDDEPDDEQTDPDGRALGERILRQADAALAAAFESMSQASTDAQTSSAPSGKGKGGRRKPRIRHHDWYASAGPRSDAERMLTLIEFADWLCAVNPLFDRDLPECWIRHPWIVLHIDALYDEYAMAYRYDGATIRPSTFLTSCEDTFNRIGMWAKNSGLLEPGHDCRMVDTSISPQRANRRALTRMERWTPAYAYAWPYGEAAAEHMMDRTAWPDATGEEPDSPIRMGAWNEAAGSDPWNNGEEDSLASTHGTRQATSGSAGKTRHALVVPPAV